MLEVLAAILALPEARSLIEQIVLDVLDRREVDPQYGAKLDQARADFKAATTPEAKLAAQNQLRIVMSGS